MSFRARFAPSPTGQVHIGNIRTAIFNWLATRHNKGTFLLRIEDTDLERSTRAAIDTLLECMKWLGLDYDEPILYQTTQSPKHLEAAKKLLDSGNAYRLDPAAEKSPLIFKLPYDCDGFEFIEQAPENPAETAVAPDSEVIVSLRGLSFKTVTPKGKLADNAVTLAGFKNLEILDASGTVIYRLDVSALSADPAKNVTVPHAAKLRFVRRLVFYDDLVKGRMAKPLDSMKDFIIVRSDGSPVFHLANVYDDITQGVTHIVRGDDHVENTFRHLFLFKLLGAPIPKYAHLPMIVNQQGKPYSKRDGDAFVGDFRSKGFLPDALFNYLSLLGWSPGDNREKMTRQELIEAFTIERALRSPAQFDIHKLTSMNAHYIAELPEEEYLAHVGEFAPAAWKNHPLYRKVADFMHSRLKTFADVSGWDYFFASPETLKFDPKALKKFLSDDTVRKAAEAAADSLAQAAPGTPAAELEKLVLACGEKAGMKPGSLNQPLRIGVTGVTVGAGIFETIEIIGMKESAERIRRALAQPLN